MILVSNTILTFFIYSREAAFAPREDLFGESWVLSTSVPLSLLIVQSLFLHRCVRAVPSVRRLRLDFIDLSASRGLAALEIAQASLARMDLSGLDSAARSLAYRLVHYCMGLLTLTSKV